MSRVADACESSGCGVGGASLFARTTARSTDGPNGNAVQHHISWDVEWDVAEIRQEKAEHSVSEVWSPIPDFCARVTLSEPSILRCPVPAPPTQSNITCVRPGWPLLQHSSDFAGLEPYTQRSTSSNFARDRWSAS
jgi:hypothetical protein